jgi:hypothetical protein
MSGIATYQEIATNRLSPLAISALQVNGSLMVTHHYCFMLTRPSTWVSFPFLNRFDNRAKYSA